MYSTTNRGARVIEDAADYNGVVRGVIVAETVAGRECGSM